MVRCVQAGVTLLELIRIGPCPADSATMRGLPRGSSAPDGERTPPSTAVGSISPNWNSVSSPGNAWIGGFRIWRPCVRKPRPGKPGAIQRRRGWIGNSRPPMPGSNSDGFIHKFKHDRPLGCPIALFPDGAPPVFGHTVFEIFQPVPEFVGFDDGVHTLIVVSRLQVDKAHGLSSFFFYLSGCAMAG